MEEHLVKQQLEGQLIRAARNYSVFMNALLFLSAFVLLAAGLLSSMPSFLYVH
jgi:hypothetical protein